MKCPANRNGEHNFGLVRHHNINCIHCGKIKNDAVNHPSHYNTGKIEVLDYIQDKFADDYLLGNVCKYISRAKHKGEELEDLQKAEFYLKRRIKEVKNGIVKE